MANFNKTFWKFVLGFLLIVAVAIAALYIFRYWQVKEEEKALQTLLREIQKPSVTDTQNRY
jgi:hypothetical protein